ncbi:MAG TPA: hypothetical protein VJU54_11080, partial [Nitrospiraceae bacterium]|nr:hypothetical protein [Nitrospiraceae bacterium]
VGLAPIAGLSGTTGSEGGEIKSVNPGISAANLFIDLPPEFPPFEPEELPLPLPGVARGMVPVDAMPRALAPMVVPSEGATLMVARGTAVARLLLIGEESLD